MMSQHHDIVRAACPGPADAIRRFTCSCSNRSEIGTGVALPSWPRMAYNAPNMPREFIFEEPLRLLLTNTSFMKLQRVRGAPVVRWRRLGRPLLPLPITEPRAIVFQ
jgi:hypothetical protein